MDVKSSTIRSCSSAEEMAAGIVPSSFAKVSMTDDGFECNICLEFAQEPVVTLCGHLYCWPCIYRWLRVHPSSQPCPVCKSTISTTMLIPLYGRGNTDMKKMNDKTIPSRPTANRPHHLQPSLTSEADHDYNYHDHDHDHDHNYHQAREDFSMSSPYRAATSMSPLFGGIAVSVFPWLAGNISQGFYYSSNHGNGGQLYFMGSGPSSSRMRRREEETKRCLSMVFVFLLCFAVWCLLFF